MPKCMNPHDMDREIDRLMGEVDALRAELDATTRRAEDLQHDSDDLEAERDRLSCLVTRRDYEIEDLREEAEARERGLREALGSVAERAARLEESVEFTLDALEEADEEGDILGIAKAHDCVAEIRSLQEDIAGIALAALAPPTSGEQGDGRKED